MRLPAAVRAMTSVLVAVTIFSVVCSGEGLEHFEQDITDPARPFATIEVGIGWQDAERRGLLGPFPSRNVIASRTNGRIEVRWLGFGAAQMSFKVYRKEAVHSDWQLIGTVPIPDQNSAKEFSFMDSPKAGTYIYGVSAMNFYGKESEIVSAEPISLP